MPKVSVIIPCYNQGRYIDEAVDSVLSQSFQDFEIIIVNDGSTDEYTNQLLKAYNKPKTTVIHTENKGVSAARNTAIRNSTGEYILPLDADDKIEKTYLEKAAKILDENKNIKLVYCDIKYFGMNTGTEIFPSFDIKYFLLKNTIHVSGFFRRTDYNKTTGYDENIKSGLEDWEFWISLLKTGGHVKKINETLLFYRRYDTSRQAILGKSKETNKQLRNYIVNKHLKFYSETLGNPMSLTEKTQKLEAKINRLKNSKAYRLGNIFVLPVKRIMKLFNK